MKKMIHPAKYKRQKRFLFVLPLIVIPFLLILFAVLGGGKGKNENTEEKQSGVNTKLPDAHFKKGKDRDKMSFYELASKDSNRLKQLMRNDPYYMKDSGNELKKK